MSLLSWCLSCTRSHGQVSGHVNYPWQMLRKGEHRLDAVRLKYSWRLRGEGFLLELTPKQSPQKRVSIRPAREEWGDRWARADVWREVRAGRGPKVDFSVTQSISGRSGKVWEVQKSTEKLKPTYCSLSPRNGKDLIFFFFSLFLLCPEFLPPPQESKSTLPFSHTTWLHSG